MPDLTKTAIKNAMKAAKPGDKDVILRDGGVGGVAGFACRITQHGTATLFARFRVDGKIKQPAIPIDPMGDGALDRARDLAREWKELGKRGIYIRDHEDAQRQAAQLEARRALSVNDLCDRYIEVIRRTKRTADQDEQRIDRLVRPAMGDLPVTELSRRDVIEVFDQLTKEGSPIEANRYVSLMSAMCGWAVQRDLLSANPASGITKNKEASRERVLSAQELRWFWEATGELELPWGAFFRVLLLTGQRKSEVGGMTTDELHDAVWRMSGERTKNGRAHDVPLADAVLAEISKVRPNSGLVFTTTGAGPLTGNAFSRNTDKLRKLMAAKAAEDEQEIEHWTPHDLRRTAVTHMAGTLQVAPHVVEAVVNHISGAKGGIAGVYNRATYDNERRRALERWAALVTDERVDNVIALESA